MSILSQITTLTELPPLSDHTPAVYSIHQVHKNDNEATNPITILTWNKLNKGHSIEKCYQRIKPYSNNPFNRDEDFKEYTSRLSFQYKFLIKEIKKKELTAILLQEINDLIYSNKLTNTIKNKFIESLELHNWKLLVTTKELNTKPMAILFNCSRLTYLEESRGVLAASTTGKNHAFEAKFFDLINRINICITTCHLDYAYDFRKDIIRYQEEQKSRNLFTVIIGDTNQSPDKYFPSFYGITKYPTNIKLNGINYELKKIDCVAASPQKDYKVILNEPKSWFFEVYNNHLYLKDILNEPQNVESIINQPFINHQSYQERLEILEDAYEKIIKNFQKKIKFTIHQDAETVELFFNCKSGLRYFINNLKNPITYKRDNLKIKFSVKEFIDFFNLSFQSRIEVYLLEKNGSFY